ncbi:ubiquinone biosynthesis O-methyltransferase-like isoform X3 [Dysidea avara]|uniref:ubiquinone biosynthesis O-methyltransferase-like isoform X3 n=1 Tax=Dysidea avara TaxID=196820 RepID=UPI0033277C07
MLKAFEKTLPKYRRVTRLASRNSSGQSQATTDDEEMQKFSQRARRMWDMNGPDVPLHYLNELRVPLIRNALLNYPLEGQADCHTPKPLKGYSILDVGCGAGILTEPLARLGASVTGVDPVEENIIVAREHAAEDPSLSDTLQYECCTVEDVASRSHQFDVVVASEVLEHVSHLDVFVSQLCATVKPGGYGVFTTINRTLFSYITAILLAEYVARLLPVGTHQWEKFITPSELEKLLKGNGFSVIFQRDTWYNPLLGRWSWCSCSGVGYAMVASKPPLVDGDDNISE